jgi:hypothetical protein
MTPFGFAQNDSIPDRVADTVEPLAEPFAPFFCGSAPQEVAVSLFGKLPVESGEAVADSIRACRRRILVGQREERQLPRRVEIALAMLFVNSQRFERELTQLIHCHATVAGGRVGERDNFSPRDGCFIKTTIPTATQPKPVERFAPDVETRRACGAPVTRLGSIEDACALQNAAERERLRFVAARLIAGTREVYGVTRHRSERDEVKTVMFEDRFEWTGVSGTQELKEAARNLEPGHVANPPESQHVALERGQSAATRAAPVVRTDTRAPQPARWVQHIEVRHVLAEIRHREAVK